MLIPHLVAGHAQHFLFLLPQHQLVPGMTGIDQGGMFSQLVAHLVIGGPGHILPPQGTMKPGLPSRPLADAYDLGRGKGEFVGHLRPVHRLF